MTRQMDILDVHEPLRGAFAGAITLHASVIGALLLYGWLSRSGPAFGDPNPSGGAVGVEVIDKIPLAHQGATNPLASDTQSQVPQTPVQAKDREKAEKPPPDAIKLHDKKAKQKPSEKTSAPNRFRPYKQLDPNQLTSRYAPQVSSPMYAPQPGSGQVGTGPNTTLGSRLAGYAAQIQSIVARNWHTSDVDQRYTTAPKVIATFELMRDGTVRNVTILQASGISSLDASVKRAILDSNPLPPIPQGQGFDKDYAKVEFTFELKR
jgi:TonB family protein